jgi:hypothetical protein
MNTKDKTKFAKVLGDTLGIYNKTPSADIVELWWRLFDGVPLEEFTQAADAWLRESRFAPTPAELLDRCPTTNLGHPDPETAWNMAPKSESETAWVTQEILCALAACQNSLDRGDYIGARVAFVETYKQQLQAARTERRGAKPWLSTGCGMTNDQALRAEQQANQLAMTVGLLPQTFKPPCHLLTRDGSRNSTGLEKVSSLLASTNPAKKLSKT